MLHGLKKTFASKPAQSVTDEEYTELFVKFSPLEKTKNELIDSYKHAHKYIMGYRKCHDPLVRSLKDAAAHPELEEMVGRVANGFEAWAGQYNVARADTMDKADLLLRDFSELFKATQKKIDARKRLVDETNYYCSKVEDLEKVVSKSNKPKDAEKLSAARINHESYMSRYETLNLDTKTDMQRVINVSGPVFAKALSSYILLMGRMHQASPFTVLQDEALTYVEAPVPDLTPSMSTGSDAAGSRPASTADLHGARGAPPSRPSVARANAAKQYRAEFDFAPEQDGELRLCAGDIIEHVEDLDADWIKGRVGPNIGIFPRSYVTQL